MKDVIILSFTAAIGGLAVLSVAGLVLDLAGRVWTWLETGYRADERQRALRALKRINGRDLKNIGRLA